MVPSPFQPIIYCTILLQFVSFVDIQVRYSLSDPSSEGVDAALEACGGRKLCSWSITAGIKVFRV